LTGRLVWPRLGFMTNQDIMRVAGESGCSPVTIRRWLEGQKVLERSRERIEAAVKRLKVRK